LLHHCKEKNNNNRSTTETRTKKKRNKKDNKQNWRYQTYKKYVHQPRESEKDREKEIKKEKVVVLLEEE
jgi:hypothetical protein